jgi:hypothetical protein
MCSIGWFFREGKRASNPIGKGLWCLEGGRACMLYMLYPKGVGLPS